MLFNFNDALVSSTRTLPVNVFSWNKGKPCSPGRESNSRPFEYLNHQGCSVSEVGVPLYQQSVSTTLLCWELSIFPAPGKHGFSFFQVKMFTGSVRVLLTSASLKLIYRKPEEATRETEHRSAVHSAPITYKVSLRRDISKSFKRS